MAPVEGGAQAYACVPQSGEQHEAHRRDPRGRSEAEQRELARVAADAPHVDPLASRPRGHVCEREQDADHEHVVEHRRVRGRDEAAVRVEQRGRERGEAVEHHLRQEPQREDGHHVQLCGPFGPGSVEREQPGDERREDHRDPGEDGEHRHRDGEDRGGRPVVVVLELLDEQRHERRRQNAAEEELVDDVGRGVGDVVGVGEARPADRVGEHGDAEEPGDAGEERAGRDGGARADEPVAVVDDVGHDVTVRRLRRVRR